MKRIVLSLAALVLPGTAAAERAGPAPLPWDVKAVSSHAPYEAGECKSCHERRGPNPGVPDERTDRLCLSCHDEIKQHAHGFRHCSTCHNAHNSVRPRLLRADINECRDCHDDR